MSSHLRLEAAAVVAGRLAEVLRAVAAEIAQGVEVHLVGDLGERQALVVEFLFEYRHRGTVDEAADAVACDALDGGRQVLGRHIQPFGKVAHLALGTADAGVEQRQELLDDIGRAVAVGLGGVAAGVELEDVVHHRQAETPHHLAVEEQVAVVEAVAQPAEVLQQDFRLAVIDLDDGVLVEADAAADAVVVRRQEAMQEFVVGGEPLHLHPRCRREVLRPVWIRHHHQVVLHDVVAALVEHEAPFPRRAQQVHAGVPQLRRIHRQKIR